MSEEKIKKWQSVKGFNGLQFRNYKNQGKTWRQVYRKEKGGKQILDYFGLMSESEAKKIALFLTDNRKKGIGAQSFEELQNKNVEKVKVLEIEEENRRKEILQQEIFNKNNTLQSYFDNIYWEKVSRRRKETTNKNILASYNKWIAPRIGHISLVELKKEDIEVIVHEMEKAGNKPRNIQYIYGIVQHIYNDAAEHFAETNPLKPFPGRKITLPKVDNEKICFLDMQEAYNLLDLLYNWQNYCRENKIRIREKGDSKNAYGMALFSLFTGLRFSSIASLKWQDIHNGLAYIRTTKNKKSISVNISNKLIQDMLNERDSSNKTDYIFKNSNGEVYKTPPRIIYRAIEILKFNEAPHRLGNDYEKIDFHALRHTYASWLAQMRVNAHEIKELMGHSTLKMTERYARLNPETVQKNTLMLAEAFTNSTASKD